VTRRARCAAQQSRIHALAAADAPGPRIAPPCAPLRPRSPRMAATASRPARGHCAAAACVARATLCVCADAARAPHAATATPLCCATTAHASAVWPLVTSPTQARR
jgi:hypothetical protein